MGIVLEVQQRQILKISFEDKDNNLIKGVTGIDTKKAEAGKGV
jgi:hypothetical protein